MKAEKSTTKHLLLFLLQLYIPFLSLTSKSMKSHVTQPANCIHFILFIPFTFSLISDLNIGYQVLTFSFLCMTETIIQLFITVSVLVME